MPGSHRLIRHRPLESPRKGIATPRAPSLLHDPTPFPAEMLPPRIASSPNNRTISPHNDPARGRDTFARRLPLVLRCLLAAAAPWIVSAATHAAEAPSRVAHFNALPDGLKSMVQTSIDAALSRPAMKREREFGRTVVTDAMIGEVTRHSAYRLVRKQPRRDLVFHNEQDSSAHPEIFAYRIHWFPGQWSKWYIPGVNDRDWKNFRKKVWRYFSDHEHEIVMLGEGQQERTGDATDTLETFAAEPAPTVSRQPAFRVIPFHPTAPRAQTTPKRPLRRYRAPDKRSQDYGGLDVLH